MEKIPRVTEELKSKSLLASFDTPCLKFLAIA